MLTQSLIIAFIVAMCLLPASAETPASAPAATLSRFGIGSCYTNNRSAQDYARWVPQMADIGLQVFRTPHTDWVQWSWKWEREMRLSGSGPWKYKSHHGNLHRRYKRRMPFQGLSWNGIRGSVDRPRSGFSSCQASCPTPTQQAQACHAQQRQRARLWRRNQCHVIAIG